MWSSFIFTGFGAQVLSHIWCRHKQDAGTGKPHYAAQVSTEQITFIDLHLMKSSTEYSTLATIVKGQLTSTTL